MKPIKLEIDGLNSFETKQVLDFEKLGDGVFGIFGKTGSGKSTILDAITLALYGKVERTKQNIDFVNTKCSKATVSFVFEMFYSGKNRRFEVSRVFSRKKNGKELDSSASLYEYIDGEKNLVEEGTVKVGDKIFSIIGLGVNEFAKCIALPQGEFSAFLQAKPSERTEIMSNIFDLSKYGEKLAGSVKERLNDFDKQVSVLTASVEMVSYATDEVLQNAKNELLDAKTEYEETSEKLNEKSNEFKNAEVSLEKLTQLDEINKKLKVLDNQKEEIEMLAKEVEKNQSANEVRGDYEKLQKSVDDEKELTEKIAELNEIKLQKASDYHSAEIDFNNFKEVYSAKIIELNSKIASLGELQKFENEIKELKQEQSKVEEKIEGKKSELLSEQENNNYIVSCLMDIQSKITKIDEFIERNKPDVDLSYALEQTKGIESELILIEDFYKKVETMIDQTENELKFAQSEYNDSIKHEKELQAKREQIRRTLEVAFEDADNTDFRKLRSVDKELEGMQVVSALIQKIDEFINKLVVESDSRKGVISAIGLQIEEEQQRLVVFDSEITSKEKELAGVRETRDEMFGENMISMMANHLKIGDVCPVCDNRVIQKSYAETNSLAGVEGDINAILMQIKSMRIERDKMLANIISLKARCEFEKTQIEINQSEIDSLVESKQKLYQRFVDNNSQSEQNFNNLFGLLQKTSDTLEELIAVQDEVRESELKVTIEKTALGTKISVLKNYHESLIDVIYDLQRKRAEREFVIFNVNEKFENLKEYKKQIAEGKNIEIEIETKKEERMNLRDEQIRVTEDKSKSDMKISEIRANIDVLNEKITNIEKQILSLTAKIMASGVPEGVSVDDEKQETDKAIAKLKFDYESKQIHYDSCKENLSRTENEYNVKASILTAKKAEIADLQIKVNDSMLKNGFSSGADLESYFIEGFILKSKQAKVNEHGDNLRLLTAQKQAIENEEIKEVSKEELDLIRNEIGELNAKVKELSERVGKCGAEVVRLEEANEKFKKISAKLEVAKRGYDTAKELSTVLRGKALAEYICEEYLQEITVSANQKLDVLMDGRYTLKFENKEFFVEDNFNDGKIRPASTLSGGETFVVSLSLALSISDAISMLSSRSMDFFFLDEGFGTLDAELCSVVISSLYKLESQNLKIGLISHVAELEESVKNKVLVTKGINGSKITVEHSL